MATLRSFRGYQRIFRERNDAVPARATPRITCTAEGIPCLDLEIRGEERIFRLILTPEETDAVTRMVYRSMAHGMSQLRAKYEPTEEDERRRIVSEAVEICRKNARVAGSMSEARDMGYFLADAIAALAED